MKIADFITSVSHPLATRSEVFRNAYGNGILAAVTNNAELSEAQRTQQLKTVVRQLNASFGMSLNSYATSTVDELRANLTDRPSAVAFLYDAIFFQPADARTGEGFQAYWFNLADALLDSKSMALLLWEACQTLSNCNFPAMNLHLLGWLCGACGISWYELGGMIDGEDRAMGMMTVQLPGDIPLDLVWCPAGTFVMGSPADEPERKDDETQHPVTLTRGYWLGRFPVTQQQYKAVMGNNPSDIESEQYPVENVSWDDAKAFCEKLSQLVAAPEGYKFDLPTEAQWEYACRAGSTTPFSFGMMLNGDNANCKGTSPYGTEEEGTYLDSVCDVGNYMPNAWGLYDMHGNVWEWCNDWYGDYGEGLAVDPAGAMEGTMRAERGGSWINGARRCRSANRRCGEPDSRYDNLGFRVALVVE